MALKKFNKNENNKKNITKIFVAFVIVGFLFLGISYAVYQEESEDFFINATVRFPKASEVTYTTENDSNITNVEEALNDLYGKLG